MTTPSDRDREAAAKIRLYAHYQGSVDGVGVTHRSWNDVREDIATAIAAARAEGEQRLREYEHEVMTERSEQHERLVMRVEAAEQEAARLADALEAAEAELQGLREIATSGPSTASGPSPLSHKRAAPVEDA